jgi:hypothetical protein
MLIEGTGIVIQPPSPGFLGVPTAVPVVVDEILGIDGFGRYPIRRRVTAARCVAFLLTPSP